MVQQEKIYSKNGTCIAHLQSQYRSTQEVRLARSFYQPATLLQKIAVFKHLVQNNLTLNLLLYSTLSSHQGTALNSSHKAQG